MRTSVTGVVMAYAGCDAMWFLGIDQSARRPAIAVLDDAGSLVESGVLSVGPAVRGAARLAAIARWVDGALDGRPGAAWRGCVEGPNLNAQNPATLFALGEVSGVVRATCAVRGVELRVVAPSQLKLFATGRGLHAAPEHDRRRSKAVVLHAVKTTWGLDFGDDDDACDAYVLARIAHAVETGAVSRRCQADVVAALRAPPGDRPRRPRRARTDPAVNL